MTDTLPMPNFWWCPTHHLYRGGVERPCADAVKPGDVDALREQLHEAREALRGYTVSEAEYKQACRALSERTKELANLRAEIRAVLDDVNRPIGEFGRGWEACLNRIRAIVDREPTTRCVNDTNGDGDCAACAHNPNALCRQPYEVQP